MRLSSPLRTALGLSVVSAGALAFSPHSFFSRNHPRSSTTELYIESFTKQQTGSIERNYDPSQNIQGYLQKPESGIICRDTLGGNVMVSGLLKRDMDRMDQTLFDMLNAFESTFEWENILAYVDDEKYAKKKLLSRSARYTGLLDKLDFSQSSEPGGLPSSKLILDKKVTSWVAYVEDNHFETLEEIYNVCLASRENLQNVAILLVNAGGLDPKRMKSAIGKFKLLFSLKHTIICVGQMADYPEGSYAYAIEPLGTEDAMLPPYIQFSRQLSYRMITDLLQLQAGADKAYALAEIYDPESVEVKLVRGLRAGGFNHAEEIEHMVKGGPQNYLDAIDAYGESIRPRRNGKAWWESPDLVESSSAKRLRLEQEKKEREEHEAYVRELRDIAEEWATREYYRASLLGTTDLDEEAYIDSVWEEAVAEAKVRYEELKETVDERYDEGERRLEAAMLEKAKLDLRKVLTEDAPKKPPPPKDDAGAGNNDGASDS